MADDNSRRSFLGVLAATAGAASLPRKAAASLAAPSTVTHVPAGDAFTYV